MKEYLYVFLGGGLGSVLRFIINRYINPLFVLPWGTFICNSFASILVGIFTVILARKLQWSDDLLYIVVIGFCGGLSTFSTFSNETLRLFELEMPVIGILNICLNIFLCLICVWIGQKLAVHYL